MPELNALNCASQDTIGLVNQNSTARSISVVRPSAKPKPFTAPVAKM